MAKNNFTHIGIVQGHGATAGAFPVELRETLTLWISRSGAKYRKSDGRRSGSDKIYSGYTLQLGTVKPVGEVL